jgi:hypothetical protein
MIRTWFLRALSPIRFFHHETHEKHEKDLPATDDSLVRKIKVGRIKQAVSVQSGAMTPATTKPPPGRGHLGEG